jgi:hypothetical protein
MQKSKNLESLNIYVLYSMYRYVVTIGPLVSQPGTGSLIAPRANWNVCNGSAKAKAPLRLSFLRNKAKKCFVFKET